VEIYRSLTALLESYDSLSDVPPWNPRRLEKAPYHWRDLVPLFEREAVLYRQRIDHKAPLPSVEPTLPGLVGLQFGDLDGKRPQKAMPATTVDFRWPYDPDRGREWSVEWRGFLLPPSDGSVTLRVHSDHPVWLEVDGRLLIDGEA